MDIESSLEGRAIQVSLFEARNRNKNAKDFLTSSQHSRVIIIEKIYTPNEYYFPCIFSTSNAMEDVAIQSFFNEIRIRKGNWNKKKDQWQDCFFEYSLEETQDGKDYNLDVSFFLVIRHAIIHLFVFNLIHLKLFPYVSIVIEIECLLVSPFFFFRKKVT